MRSESFYIMQMINIIVKRYSHSQIQNVLKQSGVHFVVEEADCR